MRLLSLVPWLTFVGHFPEGFGAGGISPWPRHEAGPEAQRLARLWVRVSRETRGAGNLLVPLLRQTAPCRSAARRHSGHTHTHTHRADFKNTRKCRKLLVKTVFFFGTAGGCRSTQSGLAVPKMGNSLLVFYCSRWPYLCENFNFRNYCRMLRNVHNLSHLLKTWFKFKFLCEIYFRHTSFLH
jgi:hypothetical protein